MDKKKDMILSVEKYLSFFGVVDNKILNAMEKIDRRFFVKELNKNYIDPALKIENLKSISQHSTFA